MNKRVVIGINICIINGVKYKMNVIVERLNAKPVQHHIRVTVRLITSPSLITYADIALLVK